MDRSDPMYILQNASRIRYREAERARENRAEIVRALNQEQVTRRELFKWGLFTTVGTLAMVNGLSPFARSAFADIPTGAPRSPLFGAKKFTTELHRCQLQAPIPLRRKVANNGESIAKFPNELGELPGRRKSYHTQFSKNPDNAKFRNPLTGRGPIEGRPPGEIFAHQRWEEYFPEVGYLLSIGQCAGDTYMHESFPYQNSDSFWCYGSGRSAVGSMPPFLIKARYSEPMLTRVYNNMPVDRSQNAGFGRNETQLHFHNAHNGAESDGAANVHHFPGTFYDYRWSTTLARADKINTDASDRRASGPDGNGGLNLVPGDFREIQGSMWAHDHRFFFTAENVYKGNFGAINYYSGPDRGNEEMDDGVNLRLPSGTLLDWGNTDFDVNLVIWDCCYDASGQLFFDIFDTEGMLGDIPAVNGSYAPFFEVLPRKYRFRLLNASMSRFWKIGLADQQGRAVPVHFIANDGNLVVSPLQIPTLGPQGMGERFDIIVDFSQFRKGDRIYLVNQALHRDGRRMKEELSLKQAIRGDDKDPVVGAFMEFRIVNKVESVDVPGVFHRASDPDKSQIPPLLTEQIPIVAPVRTRHVEFKKSGGDSRGADGKCIPDCPEYATFPWTIRINGEDHHSMNANRISMLIPAPGEVEHWTYENGGGGWDHPIHLHFEEGITMGRNGMQLPDTERLARKDVWRLGEGGSVTFQVQFGEFGGSYVNHCHNTVHEDFAMLARIQLLTGVAGSPQTSITPTPNPTPDGVFFTDPEILPEGLPRGWSDEGVRTAQLQTTIASGDDDD
ncbi:putative multicopper oxidase [Aurantimonas manganoxydans SI85-9A1]|uniref:Putative multicopper oxidase n=2 Tax=Aurantimonas manganoxydans TaxID=651183 RepID=Q1YMR1_AURMS|nr:putative multicopper oxidase [Aurantimonas manganoxydans SI85-9A1]